MQVNDNIRKLMLNHFKQSFQSHLKLDCLPTSLSLSFSLLTSSRNSKKKDDFLKTTTLRFTLSKVIIVPFCFSAQEPTFSQSLHLKFHTVCVCVNERKNALVLKFSLLHNFVAFTTQMHLFITFEYICLDLYT